MRTKMKYVLQRSQRLLFISLFALTACVASYASPQPNGQQGFASPGQAIHALITAVKADSQAELQRLFGPDGSTLISSGDPQQDAQDRQTFIKNYEQAHRMVKEPDGNVTLYLGAANWPFPIPLVEKNGSWTFDTDAGKQEILYRRIGKNELSAIEVCQQLVAAEKEHYQGVHAGEAGQYAPYFVAQKGDMDGLYHSSEPGRPEIGPLLAQAGAASSGEHTPFHGYLYRILNAQGPDAPGGAKSYIVDGKMTAGVAFVAYPAEYGSTGVETFIVDQDGTVYEKNLGPDTTKAATSITAYNPDSSWKKAE
jgi:hypothetical protein